MDYSRPELADRLAAEYVLGTLRNAARRRFENLLPAHPALRRATTRWQHRLLPLSSSTPAVQPSPGVWQAVERRLFGNAAQGSGAASQTSTGLSRWWQRLGLWQGATALAGVSVLVLAALLARPQPAQPPLVIVMSAQGGTIDGAQPVSFVASVGGDGRSLVIKPLSDGQQLALNKALELWAIPAQGAPRSLGLVSAHAPTTVKRDSLLHDTAAFAVTLEPPGGAPLGAAPGPVVASGKLQL